MTTDRRSMTRPMVEDDLDAAGRLLAARHAAHVAAEPLLDPRFADPSVARGEVAALWAVEGSSGAVVEVDGRVTGYVLGVPRPVDTWGPNVWVEAAGVAVEDAEGARDAYAAAAARWVEEGRTAHYALLPSHDADLVDAFWRLGFGLQHVHALQEAPRGGEGPAYPSGDEPVVTRDVTLRRARREDVPVLARLDLVLPEHQGRSPVFSAGHLPTYDEALADWEESFDDERFTTFVAEVDGAVVGCAVGCALTLSSLHGSLALVPSAGFLGFAAVLPEARGHGVGRALGEAVVGWAAGAGYRSVVTDFRATNLLSSRTWPRLGFRPSFLRLHRVVGY